MVNDITGFGLAVILTASATFPAGVAISEFADDADLSMSRRLRSRTPPWD